MPKKRSKNKHKSAEKRPRQIIREARRKQAHPVKLAIPPEIYSQVARVEEETSQGSLPATVIHPPGRPFKDALVVMRLESFQRWFDTRLSGEGDSNE